MNQPAEMSTCQLVARYLEARFEDFGQWLEDTFKIEPTEAETIIYELDEK